MKVTAERIPASKVLLKVEIPPDEVQKAIEKTFRDLSQRVRVPGFRPGKAPRNLVERFLGGPESVQREGVDRLIDDSFRRALRDTDTHPIGDPDIDERPDFHPGEPLVYQATVPVAPMVELGDYQAIRLEPVAVQATPQQVNEFVDELRNANAKWEPVDRGAQDHDQVIIDVVGTAGTVPMIYGPSGETLLHTAGGREVYNVKDHEHVIDVQGRIEFAPGFDEELVGLMAGSEKRFGLTLPSDFSDASLANQSIVFAVKVHSVKVRQLPDIDDELAKAVGGGETLGELRESVRQRLQGRLERDARVMFENALVETVVNRSTIEVPDVMIERQIDSQIEDLKAELGRERLTWQEYLDRAKTSEEKVRADLRPSAINSLKSYLAVREIARKEGIQVDPSEVTAEIEATAAQFGRARNAVKERLSTREQRDKIEGRIFLAKATARLAENAQQPVIASATGAEDASTPSSTEITEESAVPAEPVVSDSSAAPDASAGDDATRESEKLPPG